MSYLQSIKPTGMLISQPYPIADFSGGWTENFTQGAANKFMSGANFLLTIDRKLFTRYGSVTIDAVNYVLPSGNERVGALINYDNDTAIMAQSAAYLYVLNPNWQPLNGPTGNPALAPADSTNQVSWGTFQHQLYITNDSSNSKVCKVYVDQNGNYQTRTAGLPALLSNPNYDPVQLLAAGIDSANTIFDSFVAHVADATIHQAIDVVTQAILATGVLATDLPSLIILCTVLSQAYQSHITDAQLNGRYRTYHVNNTVTIAASGSVAQPQAYTHPACLNVNLTQGIPIDSPSAAAFVDNLLSVYKYHSWAPYTHDLRNNGAFIGLHIPAVDPIGYATGPICTPNLQSCFTAVSNLIFQFNTHRGVITFHLANDSTSLTFTPEIEDYDSLVIAIAQIRAQYNNHQFDSVWPRYVGTYTSVANATIIPAPTFVQASDGTTPPNCPYQNGMVMYASQLAFSLPFTGYQPFTTVSAANGSQFTMSLPQQNQQSGSSGLIIEAVFSLGKYHPWQEQNLPATQLNQSTVATNGTDLASWLAIFTEVFNCYNQHDASITAHEAQIGLYGGFSFIFPASTVNLYQAFAPIPTIASYEYAFHYFDTYQAGELTFDVVGPVTYVGPIETCTISPPQTTQGPANQAALAPSITSSITVATAPLTITNLPALPYASGSDNYDLANIQMSIYRTTDTGAQLYLVANVPQGTPSYIDSVGDLVATAPGGEILINQQDIYTSGGVLNFDPAPPCKYLHILNGTAMYGGIWDTGEFFPNRVRQSVAFAPDSSPGSFFDDLDDTVTGISSSRANWIVFCRNSTYRLTGQFNTLGQGAIVHERISDSIGCISNSSIVQTETGVFFAGNDGYYYTDSYQVLKITSELNNTYQSRTQTAQQRSRIYGAYDKWNHRIWWSMQVNPGDADVSESWILDLNFGVSASMPFTQAYNYPVYSPASMLFFQNVQYRGDASGFVFKHLPLYKSDPLYNIATAPAAWGQAFIPWDYASCALDFGSTFNRKWVPRITLTGRNAGNVAINILSINDNGKSEANTAPMYYKNNLRWGDPTQVWGNPNCVWNGQKQLDMWRRFPAGQMRCDFKQIVLSPAKIGIYRYEDWPLDSFATMAGGPLVGHITISTPTGWTNIQWPSDCVGYVIAFAYDGYSAEFPITAIDGPQHILTVGLPTNVTLPVVPNLPAQSWVVRGIPKNAALHLTAINLHYALMGKMQDAYHGPQDSGENT